MLAVAALSISTLFFLLLFLSLIATFYIVDVLSASQRVDYFSSCFLFFLFFSLSYFPTRSSLSLNGTENKKNRNSASTIRPKTTKGYAIYMCVCVSVWACGL